MHKKSLEDNEGYIQSDVTSPRFTKKELYCWVNHLIPLLRCCMCITYMDKDCMMMQSKSSMEKSKNQQQIQLTPSTVFKQKVIDTLQTFGSFYDANGEKYCAVSALSKYLGYDIAVALAASNKAQNQQNAILQN